VRLKKVEQERLGELIADRVSGMSGEDEFHATLEAPKSKKGLGLKEATSDAVTRYLEKLIAQGVDVSYKK
jgi:hypothetical protein